MNAVESEKYRNLTLIQGGGSKGRIVLRGRRRGRRTKTAAEIVLERWTREEFNRLTDRDGNRPSEAIQKICEGEQFPLNYFARRMVEAQAAGCTHEQVRQLWSRVGYWLEKLFEAPASTGMPERTFYQSPLRVA